MCCIKCGQTFQTPQRDREDFKSHPLNDTPVSEQIKARRCCNLSRVPLCVCVSSPGDTAGCQGTQEECCRPLVCSRICKLSVQNQRKGNIQVASDRETCAAAFCCSLRSTIQLSCIPTQSALTADDSRPVAKTAAQTHIILRGESPLFVTSTLTHV